MTGGYLTTFLIMRPPPPDELLVNTYLVNRHIRLHYEYRCVYHRNTPYPGLATYLYNLWKFREFHLYDHETPLASLYRMYQYFVVGLNINLSNEVEYFWNHQDWALAVLLDPHDPHPARYAVLAIILHLLLDAFNNKTRLGIPRDAPKFNKDFKELKSRPKIFEELPLWVNDVPPLERDLMLPGQTGRYFTRDMKYVCCPALKHNVVVQDPALRFI